MSASRAPARNPTNTIRSSEFIWSPTPSQLPASTRLQSVVRRSRVKLGPALRGNSTKLSPTLEYRQAQRPHFENVSNDEGIGSTETVMATGLANPTAYRRSSPTLPLSVRGRVGPRSAGRLTARFVSSCKPTVSNVGAAASMVASALRISAAWRHGTDDGRKEGRQIEATTLKTLRTSKGCSVAPCPVYPPPTELQRKDHGSLKTCGRWLFDIKKSLLPDARRMPCQPFLA